MTLLFTLILQIARAAHPFEACTLTISGTGSVPFTVQYDETGAVTYEARLGDVVARMYNNRGAKMDLKNAPLTEPRVWFTKDRPEYFAIEVSRGGMPISGSGTPFDDDHRPIFDGRGITTEEGAFELIRQRNPDMRLYQGYVDRDASGGMDFHGREAFVDCEIPQF